MKKVFAIVLAAVLVFVSLLPFAAVAGETEFKTYSTESTNKSTVEVLSGNNIGIQFTAVVPIRSVGIIVTTKGADRSLRLSLYKWNNNFAETVAGEPVKEAVAADWNRRELISLEFDGNGLEAGEYVYLMTLEEGDPISIEWYKPASSWIKGYANGFYTAGSPSGKVTTVSACDTPFGYTSEEVDPPVSTAPPESVIAKDSKIAVLDVDSTKWACVDGLGRTLSGYDKLDDSRNKSDKKVGIFYWTWHLDQGKSSSKAVNVQKILDEYPEARNDYHHKIWSSNNVHAYYWNEPLWGYYFESDDYVLRKHAELLADAGVDFVAFDCTNGDYTWKDAYLNLCKVWSKAREDGVKTPQISFMLNFGQQATTYSAIKDIYLTLYKNENYQDLWFYWEGKPLIIATKAAVNDYEPIGQEILNYFTFRQGQPSYFDNDHYDDEMWGWLATNPQALYFKNGKVEMTTVGVSQNSNYVNKTCSAMNGPYNTGRSFTQDKNFSYTYKYKGAEVTANAGIENSKFYGLNFQEQWDYAISKDPQVIFVTGWNEWIAGRNETWGGVDNGFPDQCDDENSRDIEPTKGDLKDYYYYQLVENVRRFKGVSLPDSQKKQVKIDISKGAEQWENKAIIANNTYANNTLLRDTKGWGTGNNYKNDGIRNDFVTLKASYDKDNIYFYAETVNDITPRTDENWMRLLIDTVSSEASDDGWEGFEFIVNRSDASDTALTLEKFTGGWSFEKITDVRYTLQGNVMQVEIPRSALGLTGSEVNFNYKWCDGNLTDGDIMTLYTDGDAAPGGRFCFVFTTEKTKSKAGCGASASVSAVLLLAASLLIMKKRTDD